MAHEIRVKGEELFYTQDTFPARMVQAGLWFFVAFCILLLSLLPLGSDRRDPYPWGACAVVWLFAAAAGLAGAVVLTTSRGITFDRKKGLVVQWRIRFGRRREQRCSLKAFDQLRVTTYLRKHSRSGTISRWYDHELRGAKDSIRMSEVASFGREDSEEVASAIAGFLKLPTVLIDQNPGDQL